MQSLLRCCATTCCFAHAFLGILEVNCGPTDNVDGTTVRVLFLQNVQTQKTHGIAHDKSKPKLLNYLAIMCCLYTCCSH